jgi:hypothetical protein
LFVLFAIKIHFMLTNVLLGADMIYLGTLTKICLGTFLTENCEYLDMFGHRVQDYFKKNFHSAFLRSLLKWHHTTLE